MKSFNSGAKWLACVILFHLVLFAWFSAARAEGDKPTATLSADILSQYIFRGIANSSQSAVIEPSVTVGYKGFSLNVWGNFDTHQHSTNPFIVIPDHGAKWNETDVTVSYTRDLCKNLSANAGYIWYDLRNGFVNSAEVYGGLNYTLPWFTVGLTAYRETMHNPGWWVELDLTKTFPLPCYGMNLDVGASFGYAILETDNLLNLKGDDASFGTFSDARSATLQAVLRIPVCKWATIAPKLAVAFPLSSAGSDFIEANSWDAQAVHVYGGINLTASF